MTTLREAIARALFDRDAPRKQDGTVWTFAEWCAIPISKHHEEPEEWAMADAVLGAIEAAGWQCVPKEPTLDMVGAARDEADCIGDIYRAMLAAAPRPGEDK